MFTCKKPQILTNFSISHALTAVEPSKGPSDSVQNQVLIYGIMAPKKVYGCILPPRPALPVSATEVWKYGNYGRTEFHDEVATCDSDRYIHAMEDIRPHRL